MAFTLNPREILSYLNELGYHNITAQQLKEFIKDLKRLIKYERKCRENDQENVPPTFPYQQFQPLHTISTKASKAKQNKKQETAISFKIRRPLQPSSVLCSNSSSPRTKPSIVSSTPNQSEAGSSREKPDALSASDLFIKEQCSKVSPKRSKSCEPTNRTKAKRGKMSYIIPRSPVKILKSDPVALYHKYQEEWKKQKLPGEDPHMDVRWAIRERLIGRPRVISAAPSMEMIARNRANCKV